jgi:hypothetical protein
MPAAYCAIGAANFARGRMRNPASRCSAMWATHPATRPSGATKGIYVD